MQVFTAAERPDLWQAAQASFRDSWPEYNLHGNRSGEYFGQLMPRHARFQVLLYDDAIDRVVGRGRAIPFRWDGSLEDLPAGIDAVGLRAVSEDSAPTAVSALAAEVDSDRQGRGLSRLIIQAMAAATRSAGLGPLVAPVRPSRKDRYPLIPIEAYSRSMEITAPVADWERWIGMELPQPGEYVFPGGLAPLSVADGAGRYWEPNIWMRHAV